MIMTGTHFLTLHHVGNTMVAIGLVWCLVLNATFSNISAISWRPILVLKEAGVVGENHRPWHGR